MKAVVRGVGRFARSGGYDFNLTSAGATSSRS